MVTNVQLARVPFPELCRQLYPRDGKNWGTPRAMPACPSPLLKIPLPGIQERSQNIRHNLLLVRVNCYWQNT